MIKPVIELKNIGKNIANNVILKDINLAIKEGEFLAIMGKSGSGKTTLLNILGTLDDPSFGSYLFKGLDALRLSSDEKARLRREELGFIFQRYNLLSLLNAGENIALPAIYAAQSKEYRQKRVQNLLASLDLCDKIHSKPNELSGGQQQRISIARALMNHPSLILADEPTGALDSKSGQAVLDILKELNQRGQSIVLVTHDKNIAHSAQRIVHIKDGKIEGIEENKSFITKQLAKDLLNTKKPVLGKESKGFYFYKTQLQEALKMSISSILAHKLRSLLTMLGIIIGIASIVCVSALGLGAKEKILSSISAIGTNTIQIVAGHSLGDIRAGRTKLALSDMQLLKNLPFLDAVEANLRSLGISTYKDTSLRALLYGVGANHLRLKGLKLAAGRPINDFDVKNNANIVVIDSNTRKNLFKNLAARDILGKVIIYNMQPLRVVGVLKPKNSYNFTDDTIRLYTPYTTSMNKLSDNKRIKAIITKVKEGFNPKLAEQDLIKILSIKRGKKDFYTINSDSIQKAVEENSATLMALISSVALISLIVGGIGVMNIMLVCVSERTKEIGIKMAIGARRIDVLMQFLIEAILICFFGCILGLFLAFGLISIFNALNMGFVMISSFEAVVLGLLSSVLIGLVFGFFPAKNAAKLNPIKALSKD